VRDEGEVSAQPVRLLSDAAVKLRWRAAVEAGVDFIATDHYERFGMARREP
jgi:hypothetical protein